MVICPAVSQHGRRVSGLVYWTQGTFFSLPLFTDAAGSRPRNASSVGVKWGQVICVLGSRAARFFNLTVHATRAASLTPSLPWCHLKMAKKARSLKPLTLFVFSFAPVCKKIFIKTHSIESRWVKGPENVLFKGGSVSLSAQIVYRLGQWRG